MDANRWYVDMALCHDNVPVRNYYYVLKVSPATLVIRDLWGNVREVNRMIFEGSCQLATRVPALTR